MKKSFSTLFIVTMLLMSPLVHALSLNEAKSLGYVGEQIDGYLGMTGRNNSSEVVELVQRINSERQSLYSDIARNNGTDISTVAALAGQKAVERTPPGQYVNSGGGWVMK